MPVEKIDVQAGWRRRQDDDDALEKTRKKHGRGGAKVAVPPLPAQRFKSTSTVAVEGGVVAEGNTVQNGSGHLLETKDGGDLARAGAARRKNNEMYHTAVTTHMSHKLVKETKKRIIAREKAAESNRKAVGSNDPHSAAQDDPDNDGGIEPTLVGRWLEPETRIMRRKAKHMQGVRSDSVERLEDDDLHHISAQRPYFKSGRFFCPRPFGRRLIEDRQEIIGILNMPRNKRVKKAGIKETHLAILADVYKEVLSNAHARIKEDKEGLTVPLAGAKSPAAVDKGVRVSLFASTLGISPLLFMREVLWASNRLYAHAVAGEMNRATWMFGCICLCLMTERELVEFIFNTCKQTDAGELEKGELDRLARGLHLSNDVFWPMFSQQLEDIAKAHENGDLLLTLDFFFDMHHKFPMILYPALRMQELVQRKTLGLHTWGRLIARLERYSKDVARQKRIADSRIKPCCLWVLLGLKK